MENAREPVKNVKHGLSAVWIGILAIFAAPFAIPTVLILGVLGFVIVLTVLIFLLCIFILTISAAVSAIPCIVVGIWMLFTSFADGVATLGLGLIGLGIGILLVMGSIALGKSVLRIMTRILGQIAKGGRLHAK